MNLRLPCFLSGPFIVLILSWLCSCQKPCTEEREEFHYIDSLEMEMITYHGFETLSFLHNHSDTVYFFGTGIQSYLKDVTIGTDECPKPIIYGEGRQFLYRENIGLRKVNINQDLNDNRVVTLISFDFTQHIFSFFSTALVLGKDTLTVLGRTYTYVSVPFPKTSKLHDSLYYDKDYGIIKVITETDIWEKID